MENLSLNEIKTALCEGRAFFRCIRNPHIYSLDSVYPETNAQKEIRKTLRTKNKPTKTKDVGTIDGNPLRSVTLAGYNAMTFSYVGFGIVDPDINNIMDVYTSDVALGFGKRKESTLDSFDYTLEKNILKSLIKAQNKERTSEEIEKINLKLNNLREHVRNKKTSYFESPSVSRPIEVCNEVIMNIQKDDINFIFFTSTNKVLHNDSFNNIPEIKELMAVYLQRELKKSYNKDFPIINYDNVNEKVLEYNYDNERILKNLKTAFNTLYADDILGLYKNFKFEIAQDKELFEKATTIANTILYTEIQRRTPHSKIILIGDFIEEFLGKEQKHKFFNLNSHAILKLENSRLASSKELNQYLRYIKELSNAGYTDEIIKNIDILKLALSNYGSANLNSIEDYEKTIESVKKLDPVVKNKLLDPSPITNFDFYELFNQKSLVNAITKKNNNLANYLLDNTKISYLDKMDSESVLISCVFNKDEKMLTKILSSNIKLAPEGYDHALKLAHRKGLENMIKLLSPEKNQQLTL